MAAHDHHRRLKMSPAEFRRRIRPYLPGTILEQLWPGARRRGYERGGRFIVGPYCPGCGPRVVWLFRADGALDCTADRPWLARNFKICVPARSRALYTFPRPWPPGRPRLWGAT